MLTSPVKSPATREKLTVKIKRTDRNTPAKLIQTTRMRTVINAAILAL